jgi:hypothetical protein
MPGEPRNQAQGAGARRCAFPSRETAAMETRRERPLLARRTLT